MLPGTRDKVLYMAKHRPTPETVKLWKEGFHTAHAATDGRVRVGSVAMPGMRDAPAADAFAAADDASLSVPPAPPPTVASSSSVADPALAFGDARAPSAAFGQPPAPQMVPDPAPAFGSAPPAPQMMPDPSAAFGQPAAPQTMAPEPAAAAPDPMGAFGAPAAPQMPLIMPTVPPAFPPSFVARVAWRVKPVHSRAKLIMSSFSYVEMVLPAESSSSVPSSCSR